MMNFIAIAFLLSYFGTILVLVPEPTLLRRADHTPPALFQSSKLESQHAVCDQEPTLNKMKDTVHEGYEKTAEGIDSAKESAKETVKNLYDQGKCGVHDKMERTEQGIQHKATQIKHGMQETGEKISSYIPSVEDAKHGIQETGKKFASYIPSIEDTKHGMQKTGEKIATFVPSKEEAALYIPGRETGKESMDFLRQKIWETKDKAASYVEDSEPASYSKESIDSVKRKLDEAKQQVSAYMQGRNRDAGFDEKLDEASAYILSKETAASYIPNIEGIKRSVQESMHDMQDKVRHAGESVWDRAQEVGDKAGDDVIAGHKGKLGEVFQGAKEWFTGGERRGRDRNIGQLEKKVHELCSWLGGHSVGESKAVGGGRKSVLDVASTRESYAYLMESAIGAIEKAKGMFEKAVRENAGEELKEKYAYLADSAKGALEAAKEVFERVATVAEVSVSMKMARFSKAGNMTRLKEVAARTKQRLSATIRPILRAMYLAAYSAVYGVMLWMTFLSGHLLSRVLPRQQLGLLQSKLFPVYLRVVTSGTVLCAIIHAVLHPWHSADKWERFEYWNFALCVGLTLLNMLIVEPGARKMMFEKLNFEKEEGRGQSTEDMEDDEATKVRLASIDTKFKRLHQMASCLNLATMGGLASHLWYLANRLVV